MEKTYLQKKNIFFVSVDHNIYTVCVCQTPKVGTYVVQYPLLELPVYLAHREWLGREQVRYLTASITNTNENSSNRVVTTSTNL